MTSDQLLNEPPGSAVFQVWADQLLQRGDPRGELVQLSRSRLGSSEVRAEIQALVAKHPEWTLGCERWFDVEFKDGFIDALVMPHARVLEAIEDGEGYSEEPALPVLGDFLSARLRRFSTETLLSAEGNHGCWGSQTATLEALMKQPRPWLRTVELDRWMMTAPLDEATGQARLSHRMKGAMHEAEVSLGSLSRLWSAAPRLEHLVVAQGLECELGNVRAPHLRTLCLGLMRVGTPQLEALAEARLPELRWLELRLMRERWRDERIDAAAVARLLASCERLEHLGLLGTGKREGAGDEVLGVLARWPRVRELRSLDLGGLDASAAAWRAFVEARTGVQKVWLSKSVVPDPEWLQAVLPVEWREPEGAELWVENELPDEDYDPKE